MSDEQYNHLGAMLENLRIEMRAVAESQGVVAKHIDEMVPRLTKVEATVEVLELFARDAQKRFDGIETKVDGLERFASDAQQRFERIEKSASDSQQRIEQRLERIEKSASDSEQRLERIEKSASDSQQRLERIEKSAGDSQQRIEHRLERIESHLSLNGHGRSVAPLVATRTRPTKRHKKS